MSAPATRDRILAAAAYVLSRQGYGETTMSAIAERAGVRAPAIYYYFDGREDLIGAVLDEGQARVHEHVSAALATCADAPALDRICAAVSAHLTVELELSDFARAVIRSTGNVPPQIRARAGEGARAYHDIWRALIADARAEGAVDEDIDPTFARMLIIGALNWAAEWYERRGSIDVLIATATRMVRGALSPHDLTVHTT